MSKKTVFDDNQASQYDSSLIAKEVHDFFGKAIRTVDARSVVGKYFTHFRATYNVSNKPTNVKYYRGLKAHITSITTTSAATLDGKFFVIRSAPDNQLYVIWYNVDGTSVSPVIANAKYIEVQVTSTDTAQLVALATELTVNSIYGTVFSAQRNGAVVEIGTVGLGEVDSSLDINTGFILSEVTGSQELVSEITIIYSGADPYYEGQLLRGYSFDIYSGKFVKNAEVSLGDLTVDVPRASEPSIQNVVMPLADTEYSIELPENTFKFLLKVRDAQGKLKLSWVAGESSTNYITLGLGVIYSEDSLKLKDGSRTLYVQSTKPGLTIEVLSWV